MTNFENYIEHLKKIPNLNVEKMLKCFEKEKKSGVRFNIKKIDKDEKIAENLQKNLKKYALNCVFLPILWCNTGFYYNNAERLGKNILHELGLYYLQEPSAMAPVEFLDIEKENIVLDLCASPGGKSTQIAQKLVDGFLIANEIVPTRAKTLCENIQRLGISNTIVLNHSPKELEKRFENYFDRILIDAPCSGEGMFRKNDDAITEWTETSPISCASRQKEIVESAYKMLKSGGKMVYSTCTFSLEENEEIIKSLLDNHNDLEITPINHEKYNFDYGIDIDETKRLKNCARLYPYNIDGEGHFFAVIHKKNIKNKIENIKNKDAYIDTNFKKNNKKITKISQKTQNNHQKIKIFEDFAKRYLNISFENYYNFGDYLYANCMIDLTGLKCLNAGIFLGETKKDYFIPSWHLAHCLTKNDFKEVVEVSEDEAKKYIEGLGLDTKHDDGWVLLCYKDLPLSFGKCVAGKIKNHYPKHLRKKL